MICQALFQELPLYSRKQLYVVVAIIIMPILQMRTPRYNNGECFAANSDEVSKRTKAVSTTQYVQ